MKCQGGSCTRQNIVIGSINPSVVNVYSSHERLRLSLNSINRLLAEVGERGRGKGERDGISPYPLTFNL